MIFSADIQCGCLKKLLILNCVAWFDQSYQHADSGRRSGNQSQRSWQVPEHDGLLGSGSFPRPSGFAAGVSAPTFRTDTHSQLNESNEPYHPPRPYKVELMLVFVPHSDCNDYSCELGVMHPLFNAIA